MSDNYIIGAGLAGLLTACSIDGEIFDAGKRAPSHRALLRFRDDSVSRLTNIPFREVRVYKEIHYFGRILHECTNALSNAYSQKVLGTVSGRSIRDLSPVNRYVAPPDLYDRLVQRHEKRIRWESIVNKDFFDVHADQGRDINIINTAPLPVILQALGKDGGFPFEFERSAIKVVRLELRPDKVDVYQTHYFPGEDTPVYRASITGSTFIMELVGEPEEPIFNLIVDTLQTFGLSINYAGPKAFEVVDQKYGKIKNLPKEMRESIIFELTRDYNVYSIGRFATWRNILLDDVALDIKHVKRLIESSNYGRRLFNINRLA